MDQKTMNKILDYIEKARYALKDAPMFNSTPDERKLEALRKGLNFAEWFIGTLQILAAQRIDCIPKHEVSIIEKILGMVKPVCHNIVE